LIDRQGDPATETAIAEMIEAGEVKRHTRRALKIYGERRRFFADLLKDNLSDQISFRLPDGGLAIWAEVALSTDLASVCAGAARLGLRFYPGDAFAMDGAAVAGARLGFARLNPDELERAVDRLRRALTRSR
jgi:GntR family transcriptional regulator/MocR family aminotransferase